MVVLRVLLHVVYTVGVNPKSQAPVHSTERVEVSSAARTEPAILATTIAAAVMRMFLPRVCGRLWRVEFRDGVWKEIREYRTLRFIYESALVVMCGTSVSEGEKRMRCDWRYGCAAVVGFAAEYRYRRNGTTCIHASGDSEGKFNELSGYTQEAKPYGKRWTRRSLGCDRSLLALST